jgi:hypothetical protein|tara:strand:+ start:1692 stop:1895 length:204 start_codon:yes stop_codon:yes gene_type:complete
MDKNPETAEEALYQGLVMQMLPNQTKSEREELNDIINNLTEMLPEHVVNMCKFNALCKFLGIGEKSE